MLIIGCDYHPSFQQIAWVNTESGECGEQGGGACKRRCTRRSEANLASRHARYGGHVSRWRYLYAARRLVHDNRSLFQHIAAARAGHSPRVAAGAVTDAATAVSNAWKCIGLTGTDR